MRDLIQRVTEDSTIVLCDPKYASTVISAGLNLALNKNDKRNLEANTKTKDKFLDVVLDVRKTVEFLEKR